MGYESISSGLSDKVVRHSALADGTAGVETVPPASETSRATLSEQTDDL